MRRTDVGRENTMAQGDGVKVDLKTLTTYAHNMGTEADTMMGQAKGYTDDLTKLGKGMMAASNPGFKESGSFHAYHAQVAGAAAGFLMDTAIGAATLGNGAEVCALNYAGADHFGAAQLMSIAKDMEKGGKDGHAFGSMDFVFDGTASSSNGVVTNAFTPTANNGTFSGPDATPPKTAPKEATDPNANQSLLNQYQKDVKTAEDKLNHGQNIDDPNNTLKQLQNGGYTLNGGGENVQVPTNTTPSSNLDPTNANNKLPQPEHPYKPSN
jgi:hypothetical protein